MFASKVIDLLNGEEKAFPFFNSLVYFVLSSSRKGGKIVHRPGRTYWKSGIIRCSQNPIGSVIN